MPSSKFRRKLRYGGSFQLAGWGGLVGKLIQGLCRIMREDAESHGEYANCCEYDVMWARRPLKGGIGRLRNDSAGSKSVEDR
jgi:hypothetical protein